MSDKTLNEVLHVIQENANAFDDRKMLLYTGVFCTSSYTESYMQHNNYAFDYQSVSSLSVVVVTCPQVPEVSGM